MKTNKGKVILCRGTGTIGERLIELLTFFAQAGYEPFSRIEEIIFEKHRPLKEDLPKIGRLLHLTERGKNPRLCVRDDAINDFHAAGYAPQYVLSQAMERADIIFDATPDGGANKAFYEQYAAKYPEKVFFAEGNTFKLKKQFGPVYIGGINDGAILGMVRQRQSQFFVVGSCNMHQVARNFELLRKAFPLYPMDALRVDLTILRRSGEPNSESVQTSLGFSRYDEEYANYGGTYHTYGVIWAMIAADLKVPKIHAMYGKLSDAFLHGTFWTATLPERLPNAAERFHAAVKRDPFTASTLHGLASKVYWETHKIGDREAERCFMKDCSYAHTIIDLTTVGSGSVIDGKTILQWCSFTPQDRNVLVSNLKMAYMALAPEDADLKRFDKTMRPFFEPKEI